MAKKKKNQIINNCTTVYLEGKISMKFAQYVLNNWKDMPGMRMNSLSMDTYQGVFFIEAYPLIEKFMKDNKVKKTESGSHTQYKENN